MNKTAQSIIIATLSALVGCSGGGANNMSQAMSMGGTAMSSIGGLFGAKPAQNSALTPAQDPKSLTQGGVPQTAGAGAGPNNAILGMAVSAMQGANPAGTGSAAADPNDPLAMISNIAGQNGGRKAGGMVAMLGKIQTGMDAAKNLRDFFLLNDSQENTLGQSVGVSLTNRYPAPGVDPLNKYVSLVGLTVASTSPRPDIRFVFGVLNTQEVNAFSGPGGYVFVTRGALGQMQDEAELAGVLSHEISHVILKHGLGQVKTAAGEQFAMDMVKMTTASKTSKLTDNLVDVVTKAGYSQPQEFDADQSAVVLMHRAGYNPQSYLNFLVRLEALQTPTNGAMSTHPGAAQRAAKVQAQITTAGFTSGATLADRFKKNMQF